MLQDALLVMMQSTPFQSITVRDISKQANLNRATFYLHYTDKFDLLGQTSRDRFHQTLVENLPDHRRHYAEDFKALVVTTCEFLATFLRDCSPLNKPFEPMIEAQIQAQLHDYILEWLQSSSLQDAVLTTCQETTATIVSWAILGTCLRWMREPSPQTPEDIAAEVYTVVVDGLWKVKPASS